MPLAAGSDERQLYSQDWLIISLQDKMKINFILKKELASLTKPILSRGHRSPGGTPYIGLHGEARPERPGTFF